VTFPGFASVDAFADSASLALRTRMAQKAVRRRAQPDSGGVPAPRRRGRRAVTRAGAAHRDRPNAISEELDRPTASICDCVRLRKFGWTNCSTCFRYSRHLRSSCSWYVRPRATATSGGSGSAMTRVSRPERSLIAYCAGSRQSSDLISRRGLTVTRAAMPQGLPVGVDGARLLLLQLTCCCSLSVISVPHRRLWLQPSRRLAGREVTPRGRVELSSRWFRHYRGPERLRGQGPCALDCLRLAVEDLFKYPAWGGVPFDGSGAGRPHEGGWRHSAHTAELRHPRPGSQRSRS
jgi:hypothetical protein